MQVRSPVLLLYRSRLSLTLVPLLLRPPSFVKLWNDLLRLLFQHLQFLDMSAEIYWYHTRAILIPENGFQVLSIFLTQLIGPDFHKKCVRNGTSDLLFRIGLYSRSSFFHSLSNSFSVSDRVLASRDSTGTRSVGSVVPSTWSRIVRPSSAQKNLSLYNTHCRSQRKLDRRFVLQTVNLLTPLTFFHDGKTACQWMVSFKVLSSLNQILSYYGRKGCG